MTAKNVPLCFVKHTSNYIAIIDVNLSRISYLVLDTVSVLQCINECTFLIKFRA